MLNLQSDKEGEEEGEEPGVGNEEEVTTDPNTAPLERIPSLHTLEKYEINTKKALCELPPPPPK